MEESMELNKGKRFLTIAVMTIMIVAFISISVTANFEKTAINEQADNKLGNSRNLNYSINPAFNTPNQNHTSSKSHLANTGFAIQNANYHTIGIE